MIAFADTNWLVAAYVASAEDRLARIVHSFTYKFAVPWHVAPIVEVECENIFARLTKSSDSASWKRFQADTGTRLVVTEEAWRSDLRRVRDLIRKYSPKAILGTLDLCVLSAAMRGSATHLLCFDTNSNLRALAAILKLKVFPELTEVDRRRMQQFR